MKKRFLYIIGAALFSTSFYSCHKDMLYPVSQTQVANQGGQPFATAARIQSQVYGLYANIRNGQLYGGRFQVYNDVKAENWINATTNSVTAYQTWTETTTSTSSEVLNLWSQCYFAINNANLFIDGMASGGTAVVGSALSANYIGEAKFIRAVSYYALLNMYCKPYAAANGASPGVPLRLKGNASFDSYDLAPATVAQVFNQIIADLDAAEAGLPSVYLTAGSTTSQDAVQNVTRASKNTAIAMKTRVYLAMGQWDKVISESAKIVSGTTSFTAPTGVAYALQSNVANVYKSPYTTTESILSMPFTTTEPVGAQNALADYLGGGGALEFYLNPTGVLADANWKTTDARRALITVKSGKSYEGGKYSGGSPYLDWAPVMRYPEVLLNLAEARVRSTNTVDPIAVNLLNAVRGRSDATTVYTVASFATPTLLTNAILQERNIEFLGEGLRWNDLWRLNLPIPLKSNVPVVNPTDGAYIWPMSGNEQLYNKLIGR